MMNRAWTAAVCAAVLSAGVLATGAAAGETYVDAGRTLGQKGDTKAKDIASFVVRKDGNLVLADLGGSRLLVVSPDDKLVSEIKLPFAPEAIALDADGSCWTGARGTLAKVGADGRVLEQKKLVGTGLPNTEMTALAVSGDHLFVTAREGYGYSVFRVARDLSSAKGIIKSLRGCCGQMDIGVSKDVIYVAENGQHRVCRYDFEGKLLGKFGKNDAKDPAAFGSCCNPMNVCFDKDGNLLTAEASLGSVKKFSPDGTFIGKLGEAKLKTGCRRVTVRLSPDEKNVYVLDSDKQFIYCLDRT